MGIPYLSQILWVVALIFFFGCFFPLTFKQKMIAWTLFVAILSGIAGFAITYAILARVNSLGTMSGILANLAVAGVYIFIIVSTACYADDKTIIYRRDKE